MENVISNLVSAFEKGALSRRQLVQGLTTLAAAVGGAAEASAADAPADSPFQGLTLDHVSVGVKDLDKSMKFYQAVFGLPLLNRDEKTKTVRLSVGTSRVVLRSVPPFGIVDHYSLAVSKFDKAAVTAKMKQLGIPIYDTGEPLNFHVVDPDGYPIQIVTR